MTSHMCVGIWMSFVCTTPVQVPEEPEGTRSPGAGVTGSCDLSDESPVSQTPVLWKSSKSPSHAPSHVTVSFDFAFLIFYLLIFAIKANIAPSKHWASEMLLAQDPGPKFQA